MKSFQIPILFLLFFSIFGCSQITSPVNNEERLFYIQSGINGVIAVATDLLSVGAIPVDEAKEFRAKLANVIHILNTTKQVLLDNPEADISNNLAVMNTILTGLRTFLRDKQGGV